MNELIKQIEKWAENKNTQSVDDIALSLIANVGQLSGCIIDGASPSYEINNTFKALVVLAKKLGGSVSDVDFSKLEWADGKDHQLVLNLTSTVSELANYASIANYLHVGLVKRTINLLTAIARNHNLSLRQCINVE